VISTYADLQTAASNWLQNTNLLARIPDFISLAEARFRRKLEDLDQDTAATISLTDGVGTLPDNFGGLKSVTDSTIGRLEYVSPSQFADYAATTGNPVVFTIIGNQIKTLPAGSGTVGIVYKLGLPALTTDNTSNWLLARAPDIYLYGTLLQAEFYGWNDERLPLIKAALDEALGELNVDSDRRRIGAAPVAPRIGRQ